ncbi:DUF5590 domain-containing protein [Halobacillus massiliensis]|uniref:cell wall elongation regulator TseB-like domain-containing protein n=1 Tax=Halobacillus massiliensis TaxID=1926286 RepID=UPI00117A4F56|nr:DUF5590 domain-containing protein [Halobacillus massiliensis]
MKMIGTQPSSRYTVPRWMKWTLVIGSILCFIIFLLGMWMYSHINASKTQDFDRAESFATQEAGFRQVDKVTRYNGKSVIHIVQGANEEGESIYGFINLADNKLLITLDAEQMISKEAVRNDSEASCSSCEWIDTQLAYEENRPVWELTYKDESNRYVFEYIDVENGERIQRFAFRQS